MTATREKEAEVRAILQDRGLGDVSIEALISAEKGVYKGLLVLAPDRAYFVSDRFGRLVFDGEFPYAEAKAPEIRKGIFGWEFQARFGNQSVRFSRLEESHARDVEVRFGTGTVAEEKASSAKEILEKHIEGLEIGEGVEIGPGAEVWIVEKEDGEGVEIRGGDEGRGRGGDASVAELEGEAESDVAGETVPFDRREVLKAYVGVVDFSDAAKELFAGIQAMEGSKPTPEEAADVLVGFKRDLDRDSRAKDLRDTRFGMKLVPPLAHFIENDRAPIEVRRLASRALACFRAKRLLNFLVYHATRERDQETARGLLKALSAIPGEASVRTLLKVADAEGSGLSGIALDVLAETAWVPVVRALALKMKSTQDKARRVAIAAACWKILRLPPSIRDSNGTVPELQAGVFDLFWSTSRLLSPLQMILQSIEENLGAVQGSKHERARAADRNLRTLTTGFGGTMAGDAQVAGISWVMWWAQVRSRTPQAWLNPVYMHALNLPVPGLAQTKEDRRKESQEDPKTEKERRAKLGINLKQAGQRAALAGLLCGAATWALFYLPAQWIDIPFVLKPVALWSVFAATGGIALGQPKWAIRTLPWGMVPGVAFSAFHLGGTTPLFLGWSLIGFGFFRARRASAPFLGAVIGAFVVFGFYVLFDTLAFMETESGFLPMGILGGVFWFGQYLPEAKK